MSGIKGYLILIATLVVVGVLLLTTTEGGRWFLGQLFGKNN